MTILLRLFLATLLLAVFAPELQAQTPLAMPDGESVIAVNIIPNIAPQTDVRLSATRSRVYASINMTGTWGDNTMVFDQIPPDRRITDACLRNGESGSTRAYAILLDNGDVVVLTLDLAKQSLSGTPQFYPSPFLPTSGGFAQNTYRKVLLSSVLAVQYGSTVYVNKLGGAGYKQDTTGLRGGQVNDLSFDPESILVACTSRGLFSYDMNNGRWARTGGLDTTLGIQTVLYARDGRMFATTNTRTMYMSTNKGTNWSRDTAGLGVVNIARMCDDAANTVYAATSPNNGGASALYRKNSGASNWSRVDTLLTTVAGGALRINDFAANNSLELAVPIGLMSSYAGPNNWHNTTKGVSAEDIYGLQFLPGGTQVVSTAVGVFRKTSGAWVQTYPGTGFSGAHPLNRADNPSTLSFQLSATSLAEQGVIMSSTDQGQTWFADTTGLSNVPPASGFISALYTMDVNAKKYIAEDSPVTLYSSPSWDADTTGFNWEPVTGTAAALCLSANKSNNTFFSVGVFSSGQNGTFVKQGFLYSRTGSGNWSLDTAGLTDAAISVITHSKTTSYAATALMNGSSSLFKRVSGGWQKLPSSSMAISDATGLSLDSAGTLFVSYSATLNSAAPNTGIVATADEGKTWQSAGLNGLTIRGLTASSDGSYAFTSRGAFKLSLSELKQAKVAFAMHQIDFGTVAVGLSKDTTVELSNSGNDTLHVANLRAANNAFVINPNTFNIAPGGKLTVSISFRPVINGSVSSTLRPIANAIPDTLLLNGIGKAAKAKLVFDGLLIDLGTTDTKTPKDTVLVIGNSGTDTLLVKNVTCPVAEVTASPTVFSIAPGKSFNLNVRWAPKKQGSIVSALHFTSNAPADSLRIIANCVETGVDDPEMAERLQLQLGPNPAENGIAGLSFVLPTATHCYISLHNSQGQIVSQLLNSDEVAGKVELSLNNALQGLSDGMYFVRLQTNEGALTTKLIIRH